jgi:alpha-glucosidase
VRSDPFHFASAEPALGDLVPVVVEVPDAFGARRVEVRSTPDGEPRYAEATVDRRGYGSTWWRAEVEARNPVTRYRFKLDTVAGPRWLTALGVFAHDVPDVFDFRAVCYEAPPPWSADAVVYQIFPDRFASSSPKAAPGWAVECAWDTPVIGRGPEAARQFYGGDLDGIAAHLDHIADLGADTVYLTPIFPAPSNHRYDASSFDGVDPLLGGDPALVRLSEKVHARGMRLIGDLTTNHCGSAHPWFAAALAGGPEREMFYFDGEAYESWLGVPSLPKLNWGSPELRRRVVEVATRWLEPPYNLDGWRVDVANMTGRRGADAYTHEVARLLRRSVRATKSDGLLVAEHAHDATDDLDRDGWHGTMNYAGFMRPVLGWLRRRESLPSAHQYGHGGSEMVATMRSFAALQSWRSLTHSWTMLGSHDTERLHSVVDQPLVEVAVGLLMTLPGVPMIFAGDEVGLLGDNGEDARRPMPWPVPDHPSLPLYRSLIALRRKHEALRRGSLRWAYADDNAVAFLRSTVDETLLVLARRGPGAPIRLDLPGAVAENLYGGAPSVELCADGPTLQIFRLHLMDA